MNDETKEVESLHTEDLRRFPVWEYVNDDEASETLVRPVKHLPATNLTGKIVGTKVHFTNGRSVWSLLGNIDLISPKITQHYLVLSVLLRGKWFTLARYHDVDYASNGPVGLAKFFGLSTKEIFPIKYVISSRLIGASKDLVGFIQEEAAEKLSQSHLISMSV